MAPTDTDAIARRREIEDELIRLGNDRERLERDSAINLQRIRALLKTAREAGITVRDISRHTGVSVQSLHAWTRELQHPGVPVASLGLGYPHPNDLTEAVHRVVGTDPDREWSPEAIAGAMPSSWPSGSLHEINMALSLLARCLQVWRTDDGYRLSPPEGVMV